MNRYEQTPGQSIYTRGEYLRLSQGYEKELGFTIPKFATLPSFLLAEYELALPSSEETDEIDTTAFKNKERALLEKAIERITNLRGNKIIVRPIPHDENKYPDLSFAGVYSSYIPSGEHRREEYLRRGIHHVLTKRFTPYSNLYYETHALSQDSSREIDILFMEFVANPAIHGTAYVYDQNVRSEHVLDPSLMSSQIDPVITSSRGDTLTSSSEESLFERDHKTRQQVIDALLGLEAVFKSPLDIEYLFDNTGQMHIVQLRKISRAHLQNWKNMIDSNSTQDNLESAIINTSGIIQGKIKDLRDVRDIPEDVFENSDSSIYVLNFTHPEKITMLDFASAVTQIPCGNPLNIVIDHGKHTRREHSAYTIMEDPHFSNIIQVRGGSDMSRFKNRANVKIESTGANTVISAE